MKNQKLNINLSFKHFFSLVCIAISFSAYNQTETITDKVESPFFQVENNSENIDLPLINSSVNVVISGIIADVTVQQKYTNKSNTSIDAKYIFPGSSKSAVYAMKMKIGEREIIAKVKEKEIAKQDFEKAKEAGKSASLLEQFRPNVFQMNVANILPEETIVVELKYTEILVPTEGKYQFVYPKVVGTRYTDKDGLEKNSWVLNPFTNPETSNDDFTKPSFDINIKLHSALNLKQLQSTSHKVNIDYQNKKDATVYLKKNEVNNNNADFILEYELGGQNIETGTLLYEGENENFFMSIIEPPKRKQHAKTVAREYIFIVDVSGSMNGFPIDISKRLMTNLIGNLNENDFFNVILFAGGSDIFSSSSVPATKYNLKNAISFIDKEPGNGGTELLPALKRALNLPKNEAYSRTMVIATDGFITVEKEAFELIRNNLNKSNVFSFGIGLNPNRFLIEGIARAGHGEPMVITSEKDAKKMAEKFRNYIQSPILTNIKIDFEGFEAYDVQPQSFPDVFAEKPLIIFGKWKGDKKGTINLTGTSPSGKIQETLQIKDANTASNNNALQYLWARYKILELSDYYSAAKESGLKEKITSLGLNYNLLTEFTSFIAVDEKNKVSNINTSTNNGAVPEPHEWVLIILVLIVVLFFSLKSYI